MQLHKALQEDLPGVDVQATMSPIASDVSKYYQPRETSRRAAVMAVLFPEDNDFHLTYIRRAFHPKDKHSGQISFPGGGLEEQDQSIEACAVRETYEETGIIAEKLMVIGALTDLYVYASDNLVTPFIGYYPHRPEYVLQQSEVAEIINIPLTHFDNPSIVSTKDLRVSNYTIPNVPYYDIEGQTLWGATAMITAELLHIWQLTH